MKTKNEIIDEFIFQVSLLLHKYKNGEYSAAEYFNAKDKLTEQLMQDFKD